MTINPVDLQVTLPQTGQVNRIQRGLQQQQQTEQQILGQIINQEMQEQEKTIKQMKPVDHNRIQNDDLDKKKEKRQNKKDDRKSVHIGASEKNKQEKTDTSRNEEHRGRLLDIKI